MDKKQWSKMLNETIYRINEAVETADALASEINSTIKKHFPNSYVESYFTDKFSPSITIRFAVGNKSDWANGILQNDVSFTTMHVWGFNKDGTFNGKLEFEPNKAGSFFVKPKPGSFYAYETVKVPVRKKTGTPEQILKSIDKYFGDLKAAIKKNVNNLSSSHEYAKKYV